MTKNQTLEEILDNEWYAVRHSGEIPEIALYSAFHFLTEDDEGPRLALSVELRDRLVGAAESRFREIVLRDLRQANRESPQFRGLRRACYNWDRYESFCRRQELDPTGLRHEAAAALLAFLVEEKIAVSQQGRSRSINCSVEELRAFALRLGLQPRSLPAQWHSLVP